MKKTVLDLKKGKRLLDSMAQHAYIEFIKEENELYRFKDVDTDEEILLTAREVEEIMNNGDNE